VNGPNLFLPAGLFTGLLIVACTPSPTETGPLQPLDARMDAGLDAPDGRTGDVSLDVPADHQRHDVLDDGDTGTQPDMTSSDVGVETGSVCRTVPRQMLRLSTATDDGATLFRFRTYTGDVPHWVSPVRSTSLNPADGGDVRLAQRGPLVDDERPFRDRHVTAFDGDDHWLGRDPIAAENPTVQAWFQTSTDTGYQTLFSNTEGGGFSLKIKAGKLRGLVRVEDGSSWKDLEIIGSQSVSDGRWHAAALTSQRTSTGYELCVWLDGAKECSSFAETQAPKSSRISPSIGAEPDEDGGAYTYKDHFTGEIFAVVVKDYVVDEAWLEDRVLRDGSAYFDTMSYHDYFDDKPSVDQRVAASTSGYDKLIAATAARYRLPFQDDRYVVQGVAAHSSGEVLLSMYYGAKDQSLTCREEPFAVHSLLVGFDPCTSKLTRVWMLEGPTGAVNTAHVGGLAVVGDQAWTTHSGADGTVLARYDLNSSGTAAAVDNLVSEDLLPSGAPRRVTAMETVAVDTECGSSYMSVNRSTKTLWIGRFSTSLGASLCSFAIDERAGIGARGEVLGLPIAKVQGVVALDDGRLLLSQSYGNNTSRLFVWTPGTPLAEVLVEAPAGLEDLSLSHEGLLWSASESGARYFQKRFTENLLCGPSWTDLYPYVFALDLGGLF
jgi:hypothetical protein